MGRISALPPQSPPILSVWFVICSSVNLDFFIASPYPLKEPRSDLTLVLICADIPGSRHLTYKVLRSALTHTSDAFYIMAILLISKGNAFLSNNGPRRDIGTIVRRCARAM